MAKDSKGHGSEKRGVSGAGREKRGAFMEKYGATGGTMASRDRLMSPPTWDGGTGKPWAGNAQAADELAQGHPKADAVPVHSGATGRNDQGHTYGSPEAIKDFTNKYGGPRDVKAEQRGFNSGKREINRLRKQGK